MTTMPEAPAAIVPLLLMPPAELVPNWVTPLTTMPDGLRIVPLLVMPPVKVVTSMTTMPERRHAAIVPLLVMPPAKVVTPVTVNAG